MMTGDMQQPLAHTSDLDQTQDSTKTSVSGGSGGHFTGNVGVPVKLFVRGYTNNFTLDDLWQLFTTYGDVSSVILESHGATITYKDQCTFPISETNIEVEMLVGDQAMMVSRVQSWPSLDLGAGDVMDPSLMYFPGQCMPPEFPQYSQQLPPNLYQPPPPLAPLYYPHIPPPLSPHYDAAILDIGQANVPGPHAANPFSVPPPPIHKPQGVSAFTFPETFPPQQQQSSQEARTQSRGGGGCHVCSTPSNGGTTISGFSDPHQPAGNKLQPLTPMTPSYPNQHGFGIPPPSLQGYYNTMTPPPSFYIPPSPVSSTLLSLSGTSVLSTDSTSSVMPIGAETGKGSQGHSSSHQGSSKQVKTATNYQLFMSPYKRFSKFSGVPTQARFPLKHSLSSSSLQGHGTGARSSIKTVEEEEDISAWYQAGDRWGHRRAVTVSENDFKETSAKSLEKAKSSSKLDESAIRNMANMKIN